MKRFTRGHDIIWLGYDSTKATVYASSDATGLPSYLLHGTIDQLNGVSINSKDREPSVPKHIPLDVAKSKMENIVKFLNETDIVDKQLAKQMAVGYSCDEDVFNYYFADYTIRHTDDTEIIDHTNCIDFAHAFDIYSGEKFRYDNLKGLRIGFYVPSFDQWHTCCMKYISYFWQPSAEHNFNKPSGKVGNLYQTTQKHALGSGWIGSLQLNVSAMSTTLGGERNPVKVDVDKYVVRWMKWADRKVEYETFSESSLDHSLENNLIGHADPDEKQQQRRPCVPQMEWAKDCKKERVLKYTCPTFVTNPVKRSWFGRFINWLKNVDWH